MYLSMYKQTYEAVFAITHAWICAIMNKKVGFNQTYFAYILCNIAHHISKVLTPIQKLTELKKLWNLKKKMFTKPPQTLQIANKLLTNCFTNRPTNRHNSLLDLGELAWA